MSTYNRLTGGKKLEQVKSTYDTEAAAYNKAYGGGFGDTPRAKELSAQADAIRQEYGLDDATYGAGASLASVKAANKNAAAQMQADRRYETQKRNQQYMDDYYNLRRQSEIAALREKADQAISDLNAQRQGVTQAAYEQRNAADAASLQNAQRLREAMAASGLLSSGENITANIGLGAARQNALYGINLDEANKQYDITRQINDINRSAAAQEQALINSINSERAGANMDMLRYYNDMDYNYDVLAQDQSQFDDQIDLENNKLMQDQYEFDTKQDNWQQEFDFNKWVEEQKIDIEWEKLKSDKEYRAALIEEIKRNLNVSDAEANYLLSQAELNRSKI